MYRREFSLCSLGLLAANPLWAQEADTPERQKTWTVGVIGHTGRGNFGHGLDVVWKGLPQARIIAVADGDQAGLEKELGRLKLEASAGYTDYREMLQNAKPEIVAICPRHVDQRKDMILAAIEAGVRGLYVEKPFVRTPAEADEIVRACEARNVKLAVAHRNRYHPVLQEVERLIADGRIGRLLEIRGRGKGDRRGGAEDLWVLGSHVLNLATYFGGSPETCSAVVLQDGRRVTREDVHEGAEGIGPLAGNEIHARYLLKNGVVAYFDSIANDQTRSQGFGIRLIGSDGVISLQCDALPLAHYIAGNPFQPSDSPEPWRPISTAGVDTEEPIPGLHKQIYDHTLAAQDLIKAIEEDRQPLCNFQEAALTIEMICAVFESHVQGSRAVPFPLQERDHPLLKL
ncbi:Gfo/Idh/MocA family protein [Rubinisphaera margarita]|uniref:Gfo/Idh/MocA family protein n=1 Tax=Rubinisphaera margarita TaxID=2909586 RepID=UPI001EE8A8A0|nr:Gfo/Idh/MocA family oxidoreductase [Rubinisphaera margarita]MCG6156473.1 Gfo/Idh/MocA family oxidoreductase [Rubinisphaera margarita]